MSVQRTVARNVLWNWGGMSAHMLAGFVIAPILVARLGQTGYGFWVLIASLTGYFDLLDLGLRGSLGRNIAFHKAKNDRAGINAVVCTGLGLLLTGSALVLLATLAAQTFFFSIFAVPVEIQPDVHLTLWLIGINLALIFPNSVFDSILWANQRFDWLNGIEIPTIVLRVALTIFLVGSDSGSLVILGAITLGVTVLSGLVKFIVCFLVDPELRLRLGFLRLGTALSLFDFGVWCFLLSVANVAAVQLGPILIGNRLGVEHVTPFSVAARLVGYVGAILMSASGVLTPIATRYHVEEKHERQRWLFIQGGKFCAALALFFTGLFVLIGDAFLFLWLKQHLPDAGAVLTVLMLGAVLPLSQWVTYSMVMSMNRHRLWAVMSLLEVGLIAGLAWILLPLYGVIGMGFAIAVPAVICRGLVQIVYACWILHVPVWQYLWQALVPACVAIIFPLVVLLGLLQMGMPSSWPGFFLYAGVYGLAFALAAGLVLVGPGQLRKFAGEWVNRLARHDAAEIEKPIDGGVKALRMTPCTTCDVVHDRN
jgi:O-antigen/teichoic acid export membrane protein